MNLQRQASNSRLKMLKVALAGMAYDRGGEMTAFDLVRYSTTLAAEFPDGDEDILAVLHSLRRYQEEYERIIPTLARLLTLVRRRRAERLRKEREASEREYERAKWQHRREHKEAYISMGEIYAGTLAQMTAKQQSAKSEEAADLHEPTSVGE